MMNLPQLEASPCSDHETVLPVGMFVCVLCVYVCEWVGECACGCVWVWVHTWHRIVLGEGREHLSLTLIILYVHL